ncbi:PEPxxWA-CTERM sorting domain-containing protein [Thermaurantiacus sp.]
MKQFSLIAGVALAISAAPAAAFVPTQFVIFGDSFIDAGSVWQFTGKTVPPIGQGFWYGRWSDGPSWADHLGYANFGAPTPAFNVGAPAGTLPPPFVPGATNFAVGGARGSFDDVQAIGVIPSLPTQLNLFQAYLAFTGQAFDPGALYIINFGNNDVNLIQSLAGNPVAQAMVANAYVTNMTNAVAGLSAAGAQHILLLGVPNPTEAEGVALQAALDLSLDALTPFLAPWTNFYRFDYFAFFNALEADPTQFGLPATLITDQNRFCLAEVFPAQLGMDCSNYLLFDGIHVTRGVQRALSIEIGRQIGIAVVPEAATWAMLIAGFGMVGLAVRRQRRIAAA